MSDVTMDMLTDQMEMLNQLHGQLLELGEEKRRVLVFNKVDELSKIRLVKKVAAQEQAWRAAVEQFVRDRGIQPDPSMTMTHVIEMVSHAEDKQRLTRLRDQLNGTIEELRRINETNRQLIEQSLQYVNLSIELMTQVPDEFFYERPQESASHRNTRRIFDSKA